jgi:PAS domain S-box-containing protein
MAHSGAPAASAQSTVSLATPSGLESTPVVITSDRHSHPQMSQGARPPRKTAFRIALLYFVVGAVWILLSDIIAEALIGPEAVERFHVQTFKGWAYIAVTAVLLYMLIRRTYTAVRVSTEARREVEMRTRLLVERVRDYAIFALDRKGNVTSWNRGAQQITDWAEAEVIGQNVSVFYTADDRASNRPKQDLDEAVETGWSEQDAPRLRQDGSQFWAASQLTALRDSAGQHTGFLCVLRDVTERREARQALEQVNRMLSSVIDASPLPIITLDPAAQVRGWNPAAERMFGWTAREVIGISLPTVPQPQREEFERMLTDHNRSQPFVGREVTRQRKDGSLVQLSLWTAPLLDAANQPAGVVGIFVDLSEFKRAQEAIRQLNESLEERVHERTARLEGANEELQAFSYTVSHDLQIPLRSLQHFASELLATQGDRLDEEGKSAALRLVGAAARMERQIEDLLEYSRASRAELVIEPVSLVLIVHELIGRLQRDPNFRDAQLVVQEPLGWVMANRVTLQQVILNLLVNAITFVRAGVRPVVNISAMERGDRVRLCVEDNGIGISEADRERVFHVFERLPAAESYPGLGVGLTVTRRGVERMGGSISIDASDTGGSRFCIELRRAEARK